MPWGNKKISKNDRPANQRMVSIIFTIFTASEKTNSVVFHINDCAKSSKGTSVAAD